MPAIKTEKLCMTYRRGLLGRPKRALIELDLEVQEGEIFGYLGVNGAGKTTTIKILVGLLRPTDGGASILGRSCADPESRRAVGFLPESPFFYEHLTGLESMDFYGALVGLSRRQRRRRGEELLERFGLAEAGRVRVREYSKGMRQRMGLAQAVINNPRVAVLDEPLSGLDPVGRHAIMRSIRQLGEAGTTVFFSSHILGDIEDACDRVGILCAGRLRSVGRLSELLASRVTALEMTADLVGAEAREKLSRVARKFSVEGERVFLELADYGAADKAQEIVREGGGRLRSLVPYKESLEEYFVRESAGGAP